MPNYLYKARDQAGLLVKGTMEAISRDDLVDKLDKTGHMVTFVCEAKATLSLESYFEKFAGISNGEKVMFYVQLANMLGAGLSLLNCLESLVNQIENKRFRSVLTGVKKNIEAGDSFSQALSRHYQVFPEIFINMAKAGEASGKLDVILKRYAEFSEAQEDLRQKIQGAIFYPVILLLAGTAVSLFIVAAVIPQFYDIFIKAGIVVPLPTRILYYLGMAIKNFWFSIILVFFAIGVGINYYVSTVSGRFALDSLKLKLPVFGNVFRRAAVSRFASTFSILLDSGVSVLSALDISRDVVGNEVLAREIAKTRDVVEGGEKICEALKTHGKEFPKDIIQMISAGEESGSLAGMLAKAADFYERMLDYAIKKMTTMLEPLLLAVIGGMVGFIMISMLLPIFDMMKMLRH